MALTCKIITRNYRWNGQDGIFVTGQIWNENLFLENDQFRNLIKTFSDFFDQLKEFLSSANGQFALIVQKEGEVWVFCSHTWSYPVFYLISSTRITISDCPGELTGNFIEKKYNSEVKYYFLNFGVTPASATLINEINQVRPGELVRFYLRDSVARNYMLLSGRIEGSQKTAEETNIFIHSMFYKYACFLKNKKVLLPLTRGYDSRLLGCLLKETGVANVTCATWGRITSSERETAEKVADKLGFPYIFIPYTEKTTGNFLKDDTFARYIDYAGHYSSMPFLQDYFAARQLLESGVIDRDTVVLPGHPGDFLRGSHLYQLLPRQSQKAVAENIITLFGTSFPLKKQDNIHIRSQVLAHFFCGKTYQENLQNFDNWDYEERQCKLIGNSSLVWSFFDIPFLMPLFDRENLSFFLKLPFEQRLGSRLFNQTAEEFIFKSNGCDFDLKSPGNGIKKPNGLKETMIRYIPHFIKKWYYPMADDVFYHELTRELIKSNPEKNYNKPVKTHFFNCYLVQWYLNRVEDQLKQR